MIHYQLRCSAAHEFDGWFRDSRTFLEQAAGGLISCPICGCQIVERALMAPALPRQRRAAEVVEVAEPVSEPVPAPPRPDAKLPPLPDSLRAVLQRIRASVERHCDDVGGDFAEQARRMHRGEIDRRGIYGRTSQEEAEALAEEGIEFSELPWVPRADG